MKNKRITLLCIMMVFATVFALQAQGQGNFSKNRSFSDAEFTDLDVSQWYYTEVSSAYELSLMNGKGNGTFDPSGSVTVAEAIALAARMNSLYQGGDGSFAQGEIWYQVYVEYALEQGIVKAGQFDTYMRNIKRSEMIQLFANALPQDFFTAINAVSAIPDVSSSAEYQKSLLLFYNAGVVMGNDSYGTFLPNSDIKRSEVAAILNRIALPENRLKKQLIQRRQNAAFYLVDDKSPLSSGWSVDDRGAVPGKSQSVIGLNDVSPEYGVAYIRDLAIQTGGFMTLETQFSIASGADGLSLQFLGSDGKIAYSLFSKNGVFNLLLPDGSAKPLDLLAKKSSYLVKITVDLDTKTAHTFLNSVDYGTTPFAQDCTDIAQYKIATSDENVLSVVPSAVRLYANYAVNESFTQKTTSPLPLGWTSEQSDGASVSADTGELVYKMTAGSHAEVKTAFAPQTGVTAFESMFLIPQKVDGVSFRLAGGAATAVTFATKNGKFYANNTELMDYTPNVWYTVGIEANPNTQTAVIKINHKIKATVAFSDAAVSVDNIALSMNASSDLVLKVDNIFVTLLPEEPQDYVPEPIVAPSDDYFLGINVCSLWRNGKHQGWDGITPFDELKPVLGYYDDGNTEVADWEIKFMAEHGIDFQLYCWFASETNAPIKTTSYSDAMLNGYMNAKYSDKMKFAILWEAENGAKPLNSEAFRNYYVPYWVEYFLKDNRYMLIDNKPVIAVFGASKLTGAFGSESATKTEFDYVRQICKDMGFDGAIFLACCSAFDDATLTSLKNSGFDAIYAYNWWTSGYDANFTIDSIGKQQAKNIIDVVPTISTGFNSVAWKADRYPNMSLSDFDRVSAWVKEIALKKYKAESWQSKFVMLSNWNEYGEGTYIMPAGLNGFGYLDHIRSAFTNSPTAHEDVKPNDTQRTRLGTLFPQDRAVIKPLKNYAEKAPTDEVKTWNLVTATADWTFWNIESEEVIDGALHAKPGTGDPAAVLKNPLELDISNVTHIKVTMKSSVNSTLMVYFKTKDDQTWNDQKSVKTAVQAGELKDYYIYIGENKAWKGILTALRIDPVNSKSEFDLVSVTLLASDKIKSYEINGVALSFDVTPVVTDADDLLPFNPDQGIFHLIPAYYKWNKKDGTLSVLANHNEVLFTMGSNSAVVNGKSEPLGCTPYLEDGLPMLPIRFVCNALGLTFTETTDRFSIQTPAAKYMQQDIAPFQYEFNTFGDNEGWTFTNCTFDYSEGGSLGGIPTAKPNGSFDPIISSPILELKAEEYDKIVVRMKHESTKDNNIARIFFKTTTAPMSEKTTVGVPIAQSSNGDYVDYVFDLESNAEWKGTVTQIRFDPFDAGGSFFVDSIRVMKKS